MTLFGRAKTSQLAPVSFAAARSFQSSDADARGYRQEEALQFIEFCIELDHQDDRRHAGPDPQSDPNVDPTLWGPRPLFDSRRAVAADAYDYAHRGAADSHDPWSRLYESIAKNAAGRYGCGWTAEQVYADPDLNGFGPWANAWLLYEGRGKYADRYALAIRGTVFSDTPSALEDAWFHTVQATQFLNSAVAFASTPNASLHSGFAHATVTLMLDNRYGVLRNLEDRHVPAGARLYLVGHSQGAAMATLTHAFLHYAMRHDDTAATTPLFGLKGRHFRLKSYVFAQPKPGDYAFSADFASITQPFDNALVINNNIDAVPQVPLTLQSVGDLGRDFRAGTAVARAIAVLSSVGSHIRRGLAALAEPFVISSAQGFSHYYNYPNLTLTGRDTVASTWDFAPAGHVLLVYGTPGDPNDTFLQHHAWMYRRLIREQLRDP